jgi:hypothetical protein
MKILFITDSLAFPRVFPEKVLYEETYISILKKKFPSIDFIHLGVGGATIRNLFQYSEYYHETLKPDIVFIQSGIVDCAPRTLKEVEIRILVRIPFLGKWLLNFIKNNSNLIRGIRNIQYTNLTDYSAYILKFMKKFDKIIWIEILPPIKEYSKKVKNIENNINTYNSELRKYEYLSCNDFNKNHVQSDFHHLSTLGHIEMANKITQKIIFYLNSKDFI